MTLADKASRVEHDVELRLDDGVVLRADVYRPDHDAVSPVVLQRTPYDKSVYGALGAFYAAAGYTYVLQDVRGQFSSDGVFDPFVHEAMDGLATVAWAAGLPGTTGEVGLIGTSYQATCAWQAAVQRPPALKAMAVAMTPVDYYDDWFFPGGAFSLAFATTWLLNNVAQSAARRLRDGDAIASSMAEAYTDAARWYRYLPLREFPPLLPDRDDVAPYFFDWITEHPLRDQYWQGLSLRGRIGEVEVPVLNVAGWYDVFVGAGAEAHQELRASGTPAGLQSRLVLGPWGHNTWARTMGDLDFGDEAPFSFPAAVVAWMDRWLKGGSAPAEDSPVRYFTMGDSTWRRTDSWPPPEGREVRLHLADGGRLVDAPDQDGAETFVYDPSTPVPSIGGHSCCFEPASPMGPYDQREVEERADVLVFTTEVLTSPLVVAGPVRVELHVSSSAVDTDFTAKLVDVHPDGRAINLVEGIVRASRRNGSDRHDLLTPGEVTFLQISLQPTAATLDAGHRLRLEVSSSNFPAFDRNPNTGAPFGQDSHLRTARQHVHHGGTHPSALVLWQLPA